MKPNLLFRLSGSILLINGALAAFMSEMFLEGAGMALDADGITTAQAFGASLIALGITVLRFPSFVGNLKEAITTAIMAHTTFVVLIGVHLINGQAQGPTPVINIVLNNVNATGFEPVTVCLEGRCSIQLSYASFYNAFVTSQRFLLFNLWSSL